MALIRISAVDDGLNPSGEQLAAQEQRLKIELSKVKGARVVSKPGEAEPGTKSAAAALGFAVEVITSPHVIAATGVVLFEWLRHNMGKSVELVIEGERIVVQAGSHKHVNELVQFLEEKLGRHA